MSAILVEEYLVKESSIDLNEECKSLIAELGLSGQEELINKSGTINPFRKMTREEYFVYHSFLTESCTLSEFKDSPIPLRVLEIAKIAKQFFQNLYVWYPSNADIKDPILVAKTKEEYSEVFHILARWGESLEEFRVLKQRALKIAREKYMNSLEKAKKALSNATSPTDEDLINTRDAHVQMYGVL